MLVYDDLDEPPAAGRRRAAAERGPTVRTAVRTLWRRKLVIASSGALFAFVAFGIGKSLPHRYTATTQLYLDPRDLQVLDRELAPRGQDANSFATVVESQARVILSTSVLDRVVREARLEGDPEFTGEPEGLLTQALTALGLKRLDPADPDSVAGRILAALGGGRREPAEAGDAQGAALDALERRLHVRRADRTFIVDISVWSRDPEKAARLANAVADAYLQEEALTRADAARRATAALTGRLDELRERVRAAENRVEAYKARNGLLGTRDVLISDQQLSEANAQLGAARARVADAEARYAQARQAQASGDTGAIAEALNSPTVGALRGQHADLRRRQAELANDLGPEHPTLKAVEVQVGRVRRLIDEEIGRYLQAARIELERARANEATTARSLEALKRQTADTGQAAVQLRELEREVEASRAVYQSFLVRSRETGEQERLNTANARVISAALPPRQRSFPPRAAVIAAVGLAAGLGLGTGLVLLAAWLRSPPDPKPASPPVGPSIRRYPVQTPYVVRLRAEEATPRLPARPGGSGPIDLARLGLPTLRGCDPGLAGAARALREAPAKEGAPCVTAVAGASVVRTGAALNLALAAARDGASVLLVDADPSGRSLSRALGIGDRPVSVDTWRAIGDRPELLVREASDGVSVLPAFRAPSGLAPGLPDVLAACAGDGRAFDLVILDGPALPLDDAGPEILELADAILLAVPPDGGTEDALDAALRELAGVSGRIRGWILCEAAPPERRSARG